VFRMRGHNIAMTDDVKKLREETGAGVMECKRAVDEAQGNIEEAKKIIYARGLTKAEKKQERATGAGTISAYIHNERIGVLLLLRCETDFVSRGEHFKKTAHEIAMHIAAMAPESVEALLMQPFIRDESKTVEDLVKTLIAQVG